MAETARTRTVTILGGILGMTAVAVTFNLSQPRHPFEHKVFVIAMGFNAESCRVEPECDCCADDLYFLTGTTFAYVGRCLSGDTYYEGTYSIKGDTMNLVFRQQYVSEILDDDYEVKGFNKEIREVKPLEFTISTCKENILLTSRDNLNGSRYDAPNERRMTDELMISKAWKELN